MIEINIWNINTRLLNKLAEKIKLNGFIKINRLHITAEKSMFESEFGANNKFITWKYLAGKTIGKCWFFCKKASSSRIGFLNVMHIKNIQQVQGVIAFVFSVWRKI